MNRDPLELLLQASTEEKPFAEILMNPLWSGFSSEDEIIAAYIDGALNAEQKDEVKRLLAANARLRQQWLHCREAVDAQVLSKIEASEASEVPATKRHLRWGAAMGVAASLVVALAITLPSVRETPSSESKASAPAMKPPATVSAAPPAWVGAAAEYDSARSLASQAAPVLGWEMYIAVYENLTQEPGGVQMPFAYLAASLSKLEFYCQRENLSAEHWPPEFQRYLDEAQQRFDDLRDLYPAELTRLTPTDKNQWCGLGARLQQYAHQAVSKTNSLTPSEDEP